MAERRGERGFDGMDRMDGMGRMRVGRGAGSERRGHGEGHGGHQEDADGGARFQGILDGVGAGSGARCPRDSRRDACGTEGGSK